MLSRLIAALLTISTLPIEAKNRTLSSLNPEARDTAVVSMQWSESYWDPRAGLIWSPNLEPSARTGEAVRRHSVRETSWYALGLLLRNQERRYGASNSGD